MPYVGYPLHYVSHSGLDSPRASNDASQHRLALTVSKLDDLELESLMLENGECRKRISGSES